MLATLIIFVFLLPCCLSFPVTPKTVLDDLDVFKDYFHRFFFIREESQHYTLEDQLRFLKRFFKLEETRWLDEWTKAIISFVSLIIFNYPRGMSRKTVEKILRKAMEVWSSEMLMSFQKVYNQDSDIEFAFLAGDHGDAYPFNGKGNILGHSFAPDPDFEGLVHFDSDEDWSYSKEGINLFLVAVHEIGHTLGLQHSHNSDSIMFPNYQYQDSSGSVMMI